MKRTLLTIFASALLLSAATAAALVRYEEPKPKGFVSTTFTGYADYAPFGSKDRHNFQSLFQPLLDELQRDTEVKLTYIPYGRDIDDWAQLVRSGQVDFMVGAYYQTETFRGLYLLYPAPIHNPITVFMLPNRIDEVKTTEDLKKLKGVRLSKEIFSDFVERQADMLDLITVDTSYAMFEKLFTKQVDYILTSYYFGLYEAIKLGLRYQIAPAKQSLWRIPMFVAVAKTSRHREILSKRLTRYLNNKQIIEQIQQKLEQMIAEAEQKYNGTVPPTFGVENMPENTKEDLTPSTKAPDWVKQTDIPKDALLPADSAAPFEAVSEPLSPAPSTDAPNS